MNYLLTITSIKSLSLFFGPILLPKAIAYYRSVRSAPAVHEVSIRPLPPKVSRALLILFVVAFSYILKTLPVFSTENIFSLTSSRLQIPTDVLFTRLSNIRPTGLTPADEALRSKITSLESRLLFFQYGPDTIRDCMWCTPDNPSSYLYYALPGILTSHLFNICILALVTSGLFTGKEGAIWRRTSTYAAIGVAVIEIYYWSSFDHKSNSRATKAEELDPFFQRIRTYRLLALALIDALFGWLLFLSSTNRAFVTPVSPAERVENTIKVIGGVRNSLGSIMILKNTIQRDTQLREVGDKYWIHEGVAMGEAMEDREVIEGVQNALEERIDMANISKDAEAYARSVVELHGAAPPG